MALKIIGLLALPFLLVLMLAIFAIWMVEEYMDD